MSEFDRVLEKYRKKSFSEKDKGTRFEKLMQGFMKTYPQYLGLFSDVWMWNEFPFRQDFGGKDTGIDLVARTVDGDFWAVQCKCYQDTSQITKKDVDTFLSTSSRTFRDEQGRTTKFAQRLWISTTNKWNSEAENTIQNQDPPVARIGLWDLQEAPVDWAALDEGIFGEAAAHRERKPKKHQQEAMDAAREYYKTHDRGKLIMACGTGKTFTSLKIAEQEAGQHGLVLFLVPSIALLGQTLKEWSTFSTGNIDAICVCSDASSTKGTTDELQSIDLALPATTDVKKVVSRIMQARIRATAPGASEDIGMTVVFSTYQSLDVVSKAQKYLLAQATLEEKAAGEYIFDFIVCDEAHRTTGVEEKGKEFSAFTKIHYDMNVQGKYRMYMTATPRLYGDSSKKKAAESDAILCSMDDPELYGEEFYRIGFGRAVEENLLCDYKVIVLTIGDDQIPPALQEAISDPNQEIKADDASKLIGCINALSKRMIEESHQLKDVDPQPMHTALAFCQRISASKQITNIFNEYKGAYYESLTAEHRKETVNVTAQHVDGSMGASTRDEKLRWLKNTPKDGNECRILTNVRCLSEGVDVPALDAVLFLSARKSQVDVVQSVGRVMRLAPGKKYGYIIIPVIVPVAKSPEEALEKNTTFDVVWSVLNALRAHDDRFNATINKIDLNKNKAANGHILIGGVDDPHYNPDGTEKTDTGNNGTDGGTPTQTTLYFDGLQGAIYARMVQKVGSRRYWEQWAKDVAAIAARHKERITALVSTDDTHKKAFQKFMDGLHKNINPYIEAEDAIEMLAQHIITRPVFEALFANYSFAKNNSVSRAMENILALLDKDGMEKDLETLKRFYDSVKERCKDIDNAEARQRVIIELYDKFFKTALPKTVGKLGIVYTPVEVVDFILHSVDDVLKKEFNSGLTKRDVHILDPFTGTGTFITRLLQSGIIKDADLWRKYTKELHANEIVLLAYYIASINIENAFHDIVGGEDYESFEGICLTDTFQLGENKDAGGLFTEVFPMNSTRVMNQKNTIIRVIVGNPPYSVGQKSANDNAQNEAYPHLEHRIDETYATGSKAKTNKALYDSYVKAFRWASDRIDQDAGGIIGFVSNAGWLDSLGMDGMRACLEEEFTSIYIFNLRGNARTSGEVRRKEKDNVFGEGSRTPVAITILVKNPRDQKPKADIFYRDIGDYLSREEKLGIIRDFGSCMSRKFSDALTVLRPNERHDWINQRNNLFDSFLPLQPERKHDLNAKSIFSLNSLGAISSRDSWIYSYSKASLCKNIQHMIEKYAGCLAEYRQHPEDMKKKNYQQYRNMNPSDISWSSSLTGYFSMGKELHYENKIHESMYRPFTKNWVYWGERLVHRRGQMDEIFAGAQQTPIICVPGIGGKREMSAVISSCIADFQIQQNGQCFPLYWYETVDNAEGSLFDSSPTHLVRRDGITDFILKQARSLYGERVTKEDIFYYVYGFLHLPAYRKEFAADLKKSLPRIMLVDEPKKFWQIEKAGRDLADIHLHYEGQPATDGVVIEGAESGNFRVQKLKFPSKDDRSTIIYNENIRITGIPERAYEYVVNGKSPVEWIMDRYRVTVDKASGIENDPNKWGEEHGNPRYILDLIMSVITVSLKTLDIVDALPEVSFEQTSD